MHAMRIRTSWHPNDLIRVRSFLDAHFERIADWSHATADMGLVYEERPPYPRLVVTGDFFVESGWHMDHFALACGGEVILVVIDDGGNPSYRPLA